MNLDEEVRKVDSKQDFVEFVNALRDDFMVNKDEWESWTIDQYLDSLAGWVEDHDVSYSDGNWQVFAKVLLAAANYE